MLNLLKTDFRRFLKDKIIYICLIITVCLTIFQGLLYFATNYLFKDTEIMEGLINGFTYFTSVISPSNNGGIIIPALITVVLLKDFSHGTIRNKITAGYSRTKIFFSSFITSLVISLAIYFINIIISLLFGIVLNLGWPVHVDGSEIVRMINYTFLGMIIYSVFITFGVTMAFVTRNMPVTIILSIVFPIVLSLIASIFSIGSLPTLVAKIGNIFSFTHMSWISDRSITTVREFIVIILSALYVVLLSLLGIYATNKKDIK